MREVQICKQIILLSQIDSQWVVHESEFNISVDWIMVHFGLFHKQSYHTALEDICNTSDPFWSFKGLVHPKMKILPHVIPFAQDVGSSDS